MRPVVDGEDMSEYDNEEEKCQQDSEDANTINQLEWELASRSGNLTGE